MLSLRSRMAKQNGIQNQTADRKRIDEMIKYALNELYSHGIYVIPSLIIRIFNEYGLNTSKLHCEAIFYTTDHIAKEKNCNFDWMKHRTLKKTNYKDKNILFNYLLYIHHDSFIEHLKSFLEEKGITNENRRFLICKLQKSFENAPENNTAENDNNDKNTQLPVNSNQNIIEEEDPKNEDQKPEDQENENQDIELGGTIKDDLLSFDDEEKWCLDDDSLNYQSNDYFW